MINLKPIQFSMRLTDYKEYFKEDTILTDYETPVFLEITPLDYPADSLWEYSIAWINHDTDESGEIRNINTSSKFSLAACFWEDH